MAFEWVFQEWKCGPCKYLTETGHCQLYLRPGPSLFLPLQPTGGCCPHLEWAFPLCKAFTHSQGVLPHQVEMKINHTLPKLFHLFWLLSNYHGNTKLVKNVRLEPSAQGPWHWDSGIQFVFLSSSQVHSCMAGSRLQLFLEVSQGKAGYQARAQKGKRERVPLIGTSVSGQVTAHCKDGFS